MIGIVCSPASDTPLRTDALTRRCKLPAPSRRNAALVSFTRTVFRWVGSSVNDFDPARLLPSWSTIWTLQRERALPLQVKASGTMPPARALTVRRFSPTLMGFTFGVENVESVVLACPESL